MSYFGNGRTYRRNDFRTATSEAELKSWSQPEARPRCVGACLTRSIERARQVVGGCSHRCRDHPPQADTPPCWLFAVQPARVSHGPLSRSSLAVAGAGARWRRSVRLHPDTLQPRAQPQLRDGGTTRTTRYGGIANPASQGAAAEAGLGRGLWQPSGSSRRHTRWPAPYVLAASGAPPQSRSSNQSSRTALRAEYQHQLSDPGCPAQMG